MGLMVALISLSVAAFGLARWLHTDIATWYQGKEVSLGLGVIALLTLSFVLGRALTRPTTAAPAQL
jgi:high-affinity nickel-transport protein